MTGADRTADRMAIIELYGRYNWAVDSTDGDAFAATFTADGAFVGSISTLRGAEALRAFAVSEALDKRGLQHWSSNIVIDFLGPDVARSRAYSLALIPGADMPVIERAGRYDDRLVRTTQGWRFAERKYFRQAAQ